MDFFLKNFNFFASHWRMTTKRITKLERHVHLTEKAGLNFETCGVVNATSIYSVAAKFSRLVADLAPKIGDFFL